MKVEEKGAVTRIARRGRGKYYDAQTAQALAPALRKVVRVALKPEEDKPDQVAGEAEGEADLPPRLKLLVEALSDANWETRKNAAANLAKLGDKAKGAVPALAWFLADDQLTYN